MEWRKIFLFLFRERVSREFLKDWERLRHSYTSQTLFLCCRSLHEIMFYFGTWTAIFFLFCWCWVSRRWCKDAQLKIEKVFSIYSLVLPLFTIFFYFNLLSDACFAFHHDEMTFKSASDWKSKSFQGKIRATREFRTNADPTRNFLTSQFVSRSFVIYKNHQSMELQTLWDFSSCKRSPAVFTLFTFCHLLLLLAQVFYGFGAVADSCSHLVFDFVHETCHNWN